MFERQERIAGFLLAAILLLVIAAHLVLTGLGKQPFARPFNSGSPDGELVVLEGDVERVLLTRSGGHMILIVHNTSVFLPADVAEKTVLNIGDRISVSGTVQTYRGNKEIIVGAAEDIRIMKSANP
jgi:hypothetical protein